MKSLTYYIKEKLIIKKSNLYKYFPKTKKELKKIIKKRIKDEGNEVDLNDIDVSKITDMSWLKDLHPANMAYMSVTELTFQ